MGSAAAQVVIHSLQNIGVGRMRFLAEQCVRVQDHPRRAVSALQGIGFHKCFLQGMEFPLLREAFDRHDGLPLDVGSGRCAGSDGLIVNKNGARPAEALSATIFGASEAAIGPQDPQQHAVSIDGQGCRPAVECEAQRVVHGNLLVIVMLDPGSPGRQIPGFVKRVGRGFFWWPGTKPMIWKEDTAAEKESQSWEHFRRIHCYRPKRTNCSDKLMREGGADRTREIAGDVYRSHSRQILATLIRLLGDFDLAEDALQDAFHAAIETWPREGVPKNPRAWLVSAGRYRGIDRMRRNARFGASLDFAAEHPDPDTIDPVDRIDDVVTDDQLRLIFTCCHPALAPDARVALTLREICGLTTEEVANAFLTTPSTLAQRIVRAKAKIRGARIPYEVPSPADLPKRLGAVLRVIYLVFNEGYSSSSGRSVTRPDLTGEAIRLGRMLMELLPDPEVLGLLGLMLIQDSRRAARESPSGDMILLQDQDRSLWNSDYIAEGVTLAKRALSSDRYGPYTIQAAIAAVHAEAPRTVATDWQKIVDLYDELLELEPSPVIELNRAVAVAMWKGPSAGLALIDAILARGELEEYHFAHSARGELYRRLGRNEEARASYQRALGLAQQEPVRVFLERRLHELS